MAARRRVGAACTFLGVLFLVLSQTQMVARAQQTAVAGAGPANGTSTLTTEEMSKLLSSMFKEISVNLGGAQGPQKGMNSTASVRDALNAVVSQQQSLGINPKQMVVEDIAAFLELPATLGTGTNIRLLQARIKQFRDLATSLSSLIPAEQYLKIRADLDIAAQLTLGFVAAFPLAQLAYSTALVALASAIIGLIAAIFFIVGASLSLSANVGGLASAKAASNKEDKGDKLADQKWLKDIYDKSIAITEPVLAFGFSDQPFSILKFADGLLGATDSAISPLVANSTAAGMRFSVPTSLLSRLG